jgi:hypothetical protein
MPYEAIALLAAVLCVVGGVFSELSRDFTVTIGGNADRNRGQAGLRVDLKPLLLVILVVALALTGGPSFAASPTGAAIDFPPSFESYGDGGLSGFGAILGNRISQAPFNLIATLIFLCAIIHTFMATKFMAISERRHKEHKAKIKSGELDEKSVDIRAGVFHFLGEIEVVFGLWVIPLLIAIAAFYDWSTVVQYFDHGVNFTEPAFVIVVMILASTRPILKLAETIMLSIAQVFGGSLSAFWITVLTIGPLLGSLITEPAAITICALLLSQRFYDLKPTNRLMYATLGLLFVNVSIGGTLTNFAAPPILMVAGPWEWDIQFMLSNFGWKAIVGILISNAVYFVLFRSEFLTLQDEFSVRALKERISREFVPLNLVEEEWLKTERIVNQEHSINAALDTEVRVFVRDVQDKVEAKMIPQLEAQGLSLSTIKGAIDKRFEEVVLYRLRQAVPALLPEHLRAEFRDPDWDTREDLVPFWITAVHVFFMAWTIMNAHHASFFILGLLFFIGFAQVTSQFQNRIRLQPAMLVGFFLAGLVIHGGLQGWWIAPVLQSLSEPQLMIGATILTAFNDNAAITYLATLVPGFTDPLKYAVVAGAVAGGGLTVIANAPNPAGQSILKAHFEDGVSPFGLLKAAIVPTAISWLCLAFL